VTANKGKKGCTRGQTTGTAEGRSKLDNGSRVKQNLLEQASGRGGGAQKLKENGKTKTESPPTQASYHRDSRGGPERKKKRSNEKRGFGNAQGP